MGHMRSPSVHGATRAYNTPTENASDTLVSEADAENRDTTRELADDGHGDSSLRWRTGPWRDDHRARSEANKIADADRVVADHLRHFTKLMKVAGYVEDKGIVVVDDQDHVAADISVRKASKMRRAFASVSSYSASGSDIAVIPPPA